MSQYNAYHESSTSTVILQDNSGIQSFRTIHENMLTRLLEADMWFEAYQRCITHPFECIPVALKNSTKHTVYAYTPLGIAARKFANKFIMIPQEFIRSTASSQCMSQGDVIKALIKACPCQLRCNQIKIGCTPLLDIIQNQYAGAELFNLFISKDLDSLKAHQLSGRNYFQLLAIGRHDSNGLSPLHRLISQIHFKSRMLAEERRSLILIECILESNPSFSDDVVSPLIHLLSQKLGSKSRDTLLLQRVTECARILLSHNPDLIFRKSVMTSCTPLHMALRNGYGDHTDLITLLLKYDLKGYQISQRNIFEDLPIHVIATVGACNRTWELLLEHTSKTVVKDSNENNDPIEGPSPLLWSTNKLGLSPLHLQWMRQMNGIIHYPMSTKTLLRSQREGMYYDALDKSVKEIIADALEPTFSNSMDEHVRNYLGQIWDVIKMILETILILPKKDCKRTNQENYLHATCSLLGPLLPLPIFDLIFHLFKYQTHQVDSFGRVPLHYACVCSSTLLKDSSFHIPSESIGWYERSSGSNLQQENVVERLIVSYPNAASIFDKNGFLSLHFAIEGNERLSSRQPQGDIDCYKKWCMTRAHGHCVIDWKALVKTIAVSFPDALGVPHPVQTLCPFMMVASHNMEGSTEIIFDLLKMFPVVSV